MRQTRVKFRNGLRGFDTEAPSGGHPMHTDIKNMVLSYLPQMAAKCYTRPHRYLWAFVNDFNIRPSVKNFAIADLQVKLRNIENA